MQPATPSSRDRRKALLKTEIRRQAFRLFAEQGYAKTSVEQIAEAANISYSTFFRYFPAKDAIAADMRFDAIFIEALEAQPKSVHVLQAIDAAAASLSNAFTAEEAAEIRNHYGTFIKIPELRATAFGDLNITARSIAQVLARHTGAAQDELTADTFAWAVVGGWIAAVHHWLAHPDSNLGETLTKALHVITHATATRAPQSSS